MEDMGMMGVPYPEEYGGADLSYVTYIGACEEMAKYCAISSVMFSAHSSLFRWPISESGTEEQKYLVPLASGEKLGIFGLTEPGTGTDAAMQKTVAEDKGDHCDQQLQDLYHQCQRGGQQRDKKVPPAGGRIRLHE